MSTDPLVDRGAIVEAVRLACGLCETVQASLVTAETLKKKDRCPVTVADYGSQAVICHALDEAYPGLPIVGEEDAAALREPDNAELRSRVESHVSNVCSSLRGDAVLAAIDRGNHDASASRYWTLDPIDGTKGFLRGEQYAVALALIEEGVVQLGILGCPNLPHANGAGCLFIAQRGGGAFTAPLTDVTALTAIHTDDISDPSAARFCESVESGHSSHSHSAQVAQRLGVTTDPVRMDSQCKYGAVARGDASIYMRLPTRKDYEERIWDHAAGAIVIEEAGGRVSDVHGKPLDFSQGTTLKNNAGVIATNAPLHNQVLAAVKMVLEA
ncbi:MAG: 3'(2'),5'-bisphosphate nucleotidase [Phycisphaerales bacterium]|nr:3'(2'),5'-bisphosphate nucleotidase [Phycisphaerales bacterium]